MVILDCFAGLAVTGAGAVAARSCTKPPPLVALDEVRALEPSPRGLSSSSSFRENSFLESASFAPRVPQAKRPLSSSLQFSTETLLLAVPVAIGCVLSSPYLATENGGHAAALSRGEMAAGFGLAPLLGFLILQSRSENGAVASSRWALFFVQICGLAAAGYVGLSLATRFGLQTVRQGALCVMCSAGVLSQAFFADQTQESLRPCLNGNGHHVEMGRPKRARSRAASRESSSSGTVIASAAHAGRFAEAYRELQRCEAQGIDVHEFLDAQDIERVRRIGSVYEESLRMLQRAPRDYPNHEKNDAIGLEWGAELHDGKFITTTIIEQDIDIVRAVAVHLEGRAERLFNPDVVSHEPIGEQHSYDTSWQKITHVRATGTKADDVLRKSVVDALDEPSVRAIWLAEYTVGDAGHAGPVTPPRAGHYRMPYLRNVMMLSLLPAGKNGRPRLRQVQFIELTPKAAAYQVLRLTPTWLKKKMLRDVREDKLRQFANFCGSTDIGEFMRDSPRAPLYEQLHKRLAREAV